MKKIYFFVFYTLFIFWEKISVPKAFSKFKAGVSIIIIDILIYYCIIYCYSIISIIKPILSLKEPIVYIPCGIIILLNVIIFDFSEKWKIYMLEFETLTQNKKLFYMIIIWMIIILVLVMFFILGNNFRKIGSVPEVGSVPNVLFFHNYHTNN